MKTNPHLSEAGILGREVKDRMGTEGRFPMTLEGASLEKSEVHWKWVKLTLLGPFCALYYTQFVDNERTVVYSIVSLSPFTDPQNL